MKAHKQKQVKGNIDKLLGFELLDDGIRTPNGVYTFYRYYPPNTEIMTETEVALEIENMAQLFDSLGREFEIVATDKVEDLREVRNFYLSLPSEFDYITSYILAALEDVEISSSAVQRAFYIVVLNDKEGGRNAYNLIRGKGYQVEIATKSELAVVLRNYLLREFLPTDIYTVVEEVKNDPKMRKAKELVFNQEIVRRLVPMHLSFTTKYAEQSTGHYRRTVMVKNFPSSGANPCGLKKLAQIPGTTFTMRLTPMSAGTAKRLTDKQLKNKSVLFAGRHTENTESIEAEKEKRIIREFYESVANSSSTIYSVNIYIELYAKSLEELMKLEDKVADALTAQGITKENLWHLQKEGFFCVNPLGKDLFLSSANNMPSVSAAALYPCSYSGHLDPEGMHIGRTADGGLMYLDIWKRDGNTTNSNLTITGTSGQGKSWLMKKILSQQYIRGVRCFIFDPDNEYLDLVKNLGGVVQNCATGEVKINPFEVRRLRRQDEDLDDDEVDDYNIIPINTATFFQHLSWLQAFFEVLFPTLGTAELKALMIFVREMYEKHGINEDSDFDAMQPKDYPIFSDLYQFIKSKAGQDYQMISKEYISTLLLFLNDCAYGSLALLMNGHTNICNDRLVCFAINELLQGAEERTRAVLFNITTYIWNIITRKEGKTILAIDELHVLCDKKNLSIVKYLQSFSKRSRKYDGSLIIGTQQLKDCLDPELATYTSALFNNASFKFLFYPSDMDMALVKDKLKLTDGEAKCISTSNRGRCLLKAGNQKYYLHVGELPYEKQLFGSAGGR